MIFGLDDLYIMKSKKYITKTKLNLEYIFL